MKAMAAEKAIRAIWAIERLSNLMDAYDDFDDEEVSKSKRRKVYVKSEDVESRLLQGIVCEDTDGEDSFSPLTKENFEELYDMISSKVNKNNLILPSLSLRLRLAIALRYLIAGDSNRKLEKISHVSRKYTTRIIPEMLTILINILEEKYLKVPNTPTEWINEARDFETFWNFPHTLGVIDARYFRVKSSSEDDSSESLILLSVFDAHSRFQHVEIIESEEYEYSFAYINSGLYRSLVKKRLNIPSPKVLKGQNKKTPYFFVANEGFGMDRYTLNAYDQTSALSRSQKAFNFRINRVLIPVQMAFEILYFRFKVFYRLADIEIDKAKLIIKTCCLIHNYLTQKLNQPLENNNELTRLELSCCDIPLPKQLNRSFANENETRDNVCKYCVNEGKIPEQ